MDEPKEKNFTNEEFAVELVRRLNHLCINPTVCSDIGQFLKLHTPCSQITSEHPTIIVAKAKSGPGDTLGFLGLMNGVIGEINERKQAFAAVYPDDTAADEYDGLIRFAIANTKS